MKYLHEVPSGLRFGSLTVQIATFGGVGLLRPASGTWGSLAAVLIGAPLLLVVHPLYLSAMAVVAYLIGSWAASRWLTHSLARDGTDPEPIVIDEVAAQWLVLSALPKTVGADVSELIPCVVIAFFLFRVFDILKPWPASWAEKNLSGAQGVMIDDIFAALWAIIVIVILRGVGLI